MLNNSHLVRIVSQYPPPCKNFIIDLHRSWEWSGIQIKKVETHRRVARLANWMSSQSCNVAHILQFQIFGSYQFEIHCRPGSQQTLQAKKYKNLSVNLVFYQCTRWMLWEALKLSYFLHFKSFTLQLMPLKLCICFVCDISHLADW